MEAELEILKEIQQLKSKEILYSENKEKKKLIRSEIRQLREESSFLKGLIYVKSEKKIIKKKKAKKKPRVFWTETNCYNEIKKYKTLKEFKEKCPGAVRALKKMGMFEFLTVSLK